MQRDTIANQVFILSSQEYKLIQRKRPTWKEQSEIIPRNNSTIHSELTLYNLSRFISSNATDVGVKLLRLCF